jgi:hypothetical protein
METNFSSGFPEGHWLFALVYMRIAIQLDVTYTTLNTIVNLRTNEETQSDGRLLLAHGWASKRSEGPAGILLVPIILPYQHSPHLSMLGSILSLQVSFIF